MMPVMGIVEFRIVVEQSFFLHLTSDGILVNTYIQNCPNTQRQGISMWDVLPFFRSSVLPGALVAGVGLGASHPL